MKFFTCLFAVLFSVQTWAQSPRFFFNQTDTIPVMVNGDALDHPWVGGTNNAQFNEFDLNQDGTMDLLVFDRSGDRLLPFVNEGGAGQAQWRFAPGYIENFPSFRQWLLTYDYNQDGKMDLIAHASAGMVIYENTSSLGQGLSFRAASNGLVLTNYGSPNDINLYVSSVDIPALTDVDEDGDMDVLTFGILGGYVEYHQNQSMELYGVPDSLDFQMVDGCYGDFVEDFSTNNVSLDTCANNDTCTNMQRAYPLGYDAQESGAHSGSTLLSIDLDGDQDKELILGDISFPNLIKLRNGGCTEYADMDEVEQDYPQSDTPLDLSIFPAGFFVDANGDGIKDLIVAPNATNISENHECNWLYLNSGTNSNPVFNLHQNDFLQDEMMEQGERAYPVFADLNGDQLLDLIVGNYGYYITSGNYTSQLAYYKNIGTAQNPSFELVTNDLGNISQITALPTSLHPALADLDNDLDLDLIIGDTDGMLHRFENTGTPTNPSFILAEPNMGGIDVGSAASPVLYDFQGNGVYDLVVGERDGTLNFIQNQGTVDFPSFTSITQPNFGGVNVVSPAFNLGNAVPSFAQVNGSTILLVGNYDGFVVPFTNIDNNLSGNFTRGDTLLGKKSNGGYAAPAAVDLNQDGWIDIALGNRGGGIEYFAGVDTTTIGIHEDIQIENLVRVFPNPSIDQIQIELPAQAREAELKILGLDGRLVSSEILSETLTSLDLSEFPNGIYVVQIRYNSKVEIHKIVKQ